jgi:spore germination protein KC
MSRKEIDEINLVLVLGIDYSDGEYTISALYSTGGGADPEKGAGSGEENIAKGKGKTPYEALVDMKSKDKKEITLAQTGSFLIGDGAAKNGLKQSIDFLSRDETIKMEALLYVIKDKSAKDFMEEGIEKKQSIHEDLKAIEQKQQELLTRNDNTLVNILNDMRQTYSCVLIPSLTAEESGYLINGYAVFDELELVDYLDSETSSGIDFIKNTIRSYSIYLKDEVGLLISYTNTKLNAKAKKDSITIKIKVDFETMLKEIITDKNIFTKDELGRLTKKQNDYIRTILEKPVTYSKEKGLDILNLARIVENQNISEWADIETSWADKIADINYEYDLNSKITKSFILGNER